MDRRLYRNTHRGLVTRLTGQPTILIHPSVYELAGLIGGAIPWWNTPETLEAHLKPTYLPISILTSHDGVPASMDDRFVCPN